MSLSFQNSLFTSAQIIDNLVLDKCLWLVIAWREFCFHASRVMTRIIYIDTRDSMEGPMWKRHVVAHAQSPRRWRVPSLRRDRDDFAFTLVERMATSDAARILNPATTFSVSVVVFLSHPFHSLYSRAEEERRDITLD